MEVVDRTETASNSVVVATIDSASDDSLGDRARIKDSNDSPTIETQPVDETNSHDDQDNNDSNLNTADNIASVRRKTAIIHRNYANTDGETVSGDVEGGVRVAIDRDSNLADPDETDPDQSAERDESAETDSETRQPQVVTSTDNQSQTDEEPAAPEDSATSAEQALATRKDAIERTVDRLDHEQAAQQPHGDPVVSVREEESASAVDQSTDNDPAPVVTSEADGLIVTLKRTVASWFTPIEQTDLVDDATHAGVPAAVVAGAVSFLALGRRDSVDQNRQSTGTLRDPLALLDRRWWRERWHHFGGKRRQQGNSIPDVDRDNMSGSTNASSLTGPAINEAFVLSTMQAIDASTFALSTVPVSPGGEHGSESCGGTSIAEVATGIAIAATIAAGSQASRSRSKKNRTFARRPRVERAMAFQGTTMAHPQGGFPIAPGIG